MISLRRNEEPRSTQVYLSTWPRKNRRAVRALLADDLGALDERSGRSRAARRPRRTWTFFVSWKLSAARCAERAERPALVRREDRLRGVLDHGAGRARRRSPMIASISQPTPA